MTSMFEWRPLDELPPPPSACVLYYRECEEYIFASGWEHLQTLDEYPDIVGWKIFTLPPDFVR